MTDLEITKKCAEKMGYKIDDSPYNGGGVGNTGFDLLGRAVLSWHDGITFDPLHDDAQAMALVKKCGLKISLPYSNGLWDVSSLEDDYSFLEKDLNRAICECVARMP